jgi:hypothetical protein
MGDSVRGGCVDALGTAYKLHGQVQHLVFGVPTCTLNAVFAVTSFWCQHVQKSPM